MHINRYSKLQKVKVCTHSHVQYRFGCPPSICSLFLCVIMFMRVFVCTVSKKNRSARCVGHQSLPNKRQRYTGTVVTNGSAFLLIAPRRERLLSPSWQRVQQWLTPPRCTLALAFALWELS